MIDVAILAGTVVSSFLVPLLKSGAEKLREEIAGSVADEAADHVTKVAGTAWDRVKGLFGSDKERAVAELFEESPDDYEKGVTKILQEKLEADPTLAEELHALVSAPAPGGAGPSVQIMRAHVAGVMIAPGATISGTAAGVIYNAPPPGPAPVSPEPPEG